MTGAKKWALLISDRATGILCERVTAGADPGGGGGVLGVRITHVATQIILMKRWNVYYGFEGFNLK